MEEDQNNWRRAVGAFGKQLAIALPAVLAVTGKAFACRGRPVANLCLSNQHYENLERR